MKESATVQLAAPFELDSLSRAYRYQAWLMALAYPYLGNRILELGSGIGNMSQHLPAQEDLLLTDVDPKLVARLEERFCANPRTRVRLLNPANSLARELVGETPDTIISFNVLEHVHDDAALLRDCFSLLKGNRSRGVKRLVSLVPAHQWAFGSLDKAFGHFRRYSDRSFRELLKRAGETPSRQNYHSQYVNLAGLLGWFWQGKVRRVSEIGIGSVQAFEKLCPLIRPIDTTLHNLTRLPLGNSLFTVYELHDQAK